MDNDTLKYIQDISRKREGVLKEIEDEALENNVPIIPPETSCLLSTLLSIKKPKRILEIGCAIGYSAGLMCSYLPDDGHIDTIDRFKIMIDDAKKNFSRLGIQNKVTLLEGSAIEVLSTLNVPYDLIFLDAAKGQYLNMLNDCMRLLNVGGLFIVDDVLQEGRIAKERLAVPRRQRTTHTRMRAFLETVSTMEGLESSIIPIGDGLLLAHKVGATKEIKINDN